MLDWRSPIIILLRKLSSTAKERALMMDSMRREHILTNPRVLVRESKRSLRRLTIHLFATENFWRKPNSIHRFIYSKFRSTLV